MKVIKKIPLLNCPENKFTSATFKNCNYSLTLPTCESIYIYDYVLQIKNKLKTCNKYIVINESRYHNEYYAIKENDYEHIYILDLFYAEVDKIKLTIPKNYISPIVSITYDYEKCKIIIAQKDKVFSVTLDGYFIKDELSLETRNSIFNNTSIIYKNINNCCYQKKITPNIFITAVGYFCGNLYVAYYKNNTAHIIKLSSNGNIIENYYIDDFIKINSIFNANDVLTLLTTKNDNYNYVYITSICCKNICSIKKDEECRIDCECNNDCNHNCYDNVIESIACMEKGLANILNCEGSKLQCGIKKAKNVCELIKLNESVANTVCEISMLEQVLYNKLKIASECCKCDKEKKCF